MGARGRDQSWLGQHDVIGQPRRRARTTECASCWLVLSAAARLGPAFVTDRASSRSTPCVIGCRSASCCWSGAVAEAIAMPVAALGMACRRVNSRDLLVSNSFWLIYPDDVSEHSQGGPYRSGNTIGASSIQCMPTSQNTTACRKPEGCMRGVAAPLFGIWPCAQPGPLHLQPQGQCWRTRCPTAAQRPDPVACYLPSRGQRRRCVSVDGVWRQQLLRLVQLSAVCEPALPEHAQTAVEEKPAAGKAPIPQAVDVGCRLSARSFAPSCKVKRDINGVGQPWLVKTGFDGYQQYTMAG